ncbi:MAG: NAD-dependent epimerase/dehydratase family protein [Pedobacter sp.]|nr:MAG: NAD-dependent epimerase/dehydratase family protein [Pedobacter sp.]
MKNILFIGGAGFIGSNLIKPFVMGAQYNVFVYETPLANVSKISSFEGKMTLIRGFLSDYDFLTTLVLENKIDKVVHLVSTLIPGSTYDDYKREYENIIFPTIKLMSFFADRKIEFIYFSSGGTVYGNDSNEKFKEDDLLAPISYYGLSKQMIENSILFENRVSKLRYLIIRPSNPFGPGQTLNGNQGLIAVAIGKILSKEELIIWGDGNSVRDYMYIDDLSDAFFQLINSNIENDIINMGSGFGYSINDIIEHLNAVVIEDVKVRYEKSRSVDVSRMVLDITKLHSYISVQHTPLAIGIKQFYDFIKEPK